MALGDALLERSTRAEIGPAPYLAWIQARGVDMPRAKKRDGTLAVLGAREPELFDAFLAAGGDSFQRVKSTSDDGGLEPLWESLRENAERWRDAPLLARLESWSREHAGDRVAERELSAYFDRVSGYGGVDYLKSRKDWTEVTGPRGRSAPLAAAWGRSAHIKAFWSVKKANAAAARLDDDGRCLIHAMVAKGKDAPDGTVDYLAALFPKAPRDKLGRGIVASLHFMPAEGSGRDDNFEWFFHGAERARAPQAWNKASDWFSCPDPEMAQNFADWLTNERYLGFNPQGQRGGASRQVDELSKLCLHLDSASFASLDPRIAGALAFNLAIAPQSFSFPGLAQEAATLCSQLLGQGARVEASAERMDLLRKHGRSTTVSMIEASIHAAAEARAIGAATGGAKAELPAPARRI